MKNKESLFSSIEEKNLKKNAPLAQKMRPLQLDDFTGQEHFVGEGKLLNRMVKADRITSLIFYGPPGTGKTSLATVIANITKAEYHYLSAPSASVNQIRDIIAKAKDNLAAGDKRTILFIDEIHRFNRAQQDVLLDDVEKGTVILIGATTENPFFSVNSPLVSRSTIFEFKPLEPGDIKEILKNAIEDKERGLGKFNIETDEKALDFLAIASDGDARKALTALEVAVLSQAENEKKEINIDMEIVRESIQKKAVIYEPGGDTHYDLASAFQKSMRGSDPNAAVYWLARMITGGEDPRFISRRIAVCAAEDVGNADPTATILAASAVQIAEFVGFPEAQLPLAQAAIYVACAPKSNASSKAIWQALSDVQDQKIAQVPKHLKDSHYAGAKKMGYGKDYKYPHNYESGYVKQKYLPEDFDKQYYHPTNRGREKTFSEYLQKLEILIKNDNKD